MIKKALAFVLLLAAGFLILYAATGGATLAGPGTTGIRQPDPQQADDAAPGIRVPLDEEREAGDGLTVSIRGELTLTEVSEVVLPDGSHRQLELYRLHAADSRPRRDLGGIYELQDVTVELFETRGTPELLAAVKAGELRASLAFVELGQDEDGRRSVAMDRDIDLRDAVLETNEHARVKNLKLSIERALVRSTPSRLYVRTATDEQPFTLEIASADGPATLSGLGLRAEFPANEVEGPAEPASIAVARQPRLVHRGPSGESRLSAEGPLAYVEDPATATAVVTAADGVRLEGVEPAASGAAGGGSQPLVASGERLHATLHRGRGDGAAGRPRITWRTMRLTGSAERPAAIRGRGIDLVCAAVDVTPNLDGEPCVFTASGSPRLDCETDGRAMHFEAAQRIHLVRLQPYLTPWLRPRGWSTLLADPHLGELFTFEGRSSLTLPHGEGRLELGAERGLLVLRGLEGTELMTVLGQGPIELASSGDAERLAVSGSDGFALHADRSAQVLYLGPCAPDPRHRFRLDAGELVASGTGALRLLRPSAQDQPAEIRLESPAADLELTIPGTTGGLRQVATLTASFASGAVRQFDARGKACRLSWRGEQGEIDGTATHIHSTSPETWFLEGAPAEVVSDRGRFEGHRIRIVRLTPQHALLDAVGQARLRARPPPGGEAATAAGAPNAMRLDLAAGRIVYLPFAAPPALLDLHLSPCALPDMVRALPSPLRRPLLLARGDVVIEHLDQDDRPQSRATGDDLALEVGAVPGGRLLGAPAIVTRRDPSGQDMRAEAPMVVLAGGEGQNLSLWPWPGGRALIEIGNRQGPLGSFGSSDGTTRVLCDGPVHVEQASIYFDGAVEVESLGADGAVEPDGFHVAAGRMRMARDPATGEIASIHTTDGTDLRWRGIEIASSEASLDLAHHLGTVVDGDGDARVRLPNGTRGRFSRFEFNYLTYESTAWHGRVTGGRAAR